MVTYVFILFDHGEKRHHLDEGRGTNKHHLSEDIEVGIIGSIGRQERDWRKVRIDPRTGEFHPRKFERTPGGHTISLLGTFSSWKSHHVSCGKRV